MQLARAIEAAKLVGRLAAGGVALVLGVGSYIILTTIAFMGYHSLLVNAVFLWPFVVGLALGWRLRERVSGKTLLLIGGGSVIFLSGTLGGPHVGVVWAPIGVILLGVGTGRAIRADIWHYMLRLRAQSPESTGSPQVR